MIIYRGISIESDIDLNNVGVSWSLDRNVAYDRGEEMAALKDHKCFIVLKADVPIEMINIDNTLFALDTRPFEHEIVLLQGIDITFEIESVYGEIALVDSGILTTGNTGYNWFEDYAVRYDGPFTIEDLQENIEAFQ